MEENKMELTTDKQFVKNAVESAIRIGLIFILVWWAYQIMLPFIVPVLWGAIIAIAVAPFIGKLENILNGRRTLASVLFTLLALSLLLLPTIMLSGNIVENIQNLAHALREGTLTIPTPPERIFDIPIIGEKLHTIWTLASENIDAAVSQFAPQIKMVGGILLKGAGGALASLIQFVVAIILAGIFLANTNASVKATKNIATRIFGAQGVEWVVLSAATIRSVVQGVLGIALIQATFAGIGLYMIGAPAPGILALLVLAVAIVQLPPLLILGPVAAYVFTYADNTPAIIFLVYSIIVSMSDSFLKPLLLGRGVDIPMLVILLGAIGGMLMSGIIGLFLGAVILALAYKLFVAWIHDDPSHEAIEST